MSELKIGNTYKFDSGEGENLIYIGKELGWNQFEQVSNRGVVWCELLDEDLWMISEVTND